MDDPDLTPALRRELAELEAISFVAHRDAGAALAALTEYGEAAALAWLRAARTLFEHDRDAGKAYIRGSAEVAEAAGELLPWVERMLRFAQWRGSWRAVEGAMEHLAPAYRLLGRAGALAWLDLGLLWCGRGLEAGAAYFAQPVATLMGPSGDVTALRALLAPAEALYGERRLPLAIYLAGAPRARDLLGADALAVWARRGADVLQAGRLRGEAYFRLESEESRDVLLQHLPGYRLPEHRRVLGLVLAAWLGEAYELRVSEWSPEQGRPFVETDGAALYVPAAMAQREEAWLAVLHAAGHLRFDGCERGAIDELHRRADLAQPSLDADRRVTWRPLFAPYGADMVRFQLIFDLCEDHRIDAALARVIPNYLPRLLAAARAANVPEGPAGAYFRAAAQGLEALAQGGGGMLAVLAQSSATLVDAWALAQELYDEGSFPPMTLAQRAAAYLPWRGPNAARAVYPRARSGARAEDAVDASQPQPAEPSSAGRKDRPEAGDERELDTLAEQTAGSGGRVGAGVPQPARFAARVRAAAVGVQGLPYAEWDYRESAYKARWAWVQERTLSERDETGAQACLARHAPVLARLKRALQAQQPRRPAPRRRQWEGDELDLDAALEFIAERKAGLAPKPAVYRQRRLLQRDASVLLLADLSTSIMQPATAGGRVVDSLRAAMLLFAESLEAVGDPYALCGFASKYRDGVSFYTLKDFDAPLTADVRAQLGGLSGRLATRMGAALRHAVTRFDGRCARQLLLIVSDGRPADYDDGGDERYLMEDTRMAVKEAVDAGVHPFCLTLDAGGTDYLPRVFGPGHYLVLDRIEALPQKLPEIYLRLRR